jgi:hypothetical protein
VVVIACALPARAQWDDGETPYVQSPMDVVDRMLRLAEPKPGEFLIDLGSGDGRIVVEAAKRYGTHGLGVDLDPRLVALARELMPKLLELKPGTRIVTHDYDMGPWPFDEMVELPVAEKLVGPLGRSKAFLFIVPADVRGTWHSALADHGGAWEFHIAQHYQQLEVKAAGGGHEQAVRGSRLRGDEIRLIVTGVIGGKPWNQAFRGRVKGERIEGAVAISNGEDSRTLPWQAIRTP